MCTIQSQVDLAVKLIATLKDQPRTCIQARGVGQDHVHHEALTKIIIFNTAILLVKSTKPHKK